jgi:hypothetical protein
MFDVFDVWRLIFDKLKLLSLYLFVLLLALITATSLKWCVFVLSLKINERKFNIYFIKLLVMSKKDAGPWSLHLHLSQIIIISKLGGLHMSRHWQKKLVSAVEKSWSWPWRYVNVGGWGTSKIRTSKHFFKLIRTLRMKWLIRTSILFVFLTT